MNNEKTGKFIKKLREENNWSQCELADKIFVDRTMVSKWEKGMIIVSSANLISLSKLFHISVDEILAGERKTEKNKDLIENVSLNIYDDLNSKVKKQRGKIWVLVILLFVFAFLFFLSFFLNFYSSVKVYRVSYATDSFSSTSGLFFENKERVYFYLDNDFGDRKDEIERITLYYELDNKRQDIYSVNYPALINFIDYNGYEEYFDFDRIDETINNFYIEFELTDGKKENAKIQFYLDYINKNVIAEKEESISDDVKVVEEEEIEKSELYSKVKILSERAAKDENAEYYDIKIDGIKYGVFILDETIMVEFSKDGKGYRYIYHGYGYEYFYLNETRKGSSDEQVYSYCLHEKECSNDRCETVEENLKIFEEIIDEVLKK